MKVVCDNCRAVYKIPDEKLVKPINKATCRNCGYRMLIPRPPASADSEFSTLVTAVPPTPIGAPAREESGSTVDLEDPNENADSTEVIKAPSNTTKPGDQKLDSIDLVLVAETESKDPEIEVSSSPSVPDDSFLGAEEETRVTQLSGRQFRTGDTVKASSPLSRPPVQRYDPRGDLTIAAAGILAAMFGTFPMAALAFFPNPYFLWVGQAVAFGGAATALLVILTSGRGRQPASRYLSVVIGGFLAIFVASLTTVGQVVSSEWDFDWAPSEQVRSEAVIEEPEAEDLEPKEAIADAEGDQVPVGEDGALQGTEDDAPAQNDEGDDNGAAKAVATPTISSRSTRSTSSRAAKPASAAPSSTSDELDDILDMPSPAPKDEWEDENFEDELDLDDDILDAKPPTRRPEPEPKKSISTVPIEVIDVMLRNNMEVKRCFGYYAQAHGGKLPARIDVKFTLQTSGRASSLTIKQAEHNKTDIEQCLRTAIGSITFPPSGKSQKLTYPFILQ